MPLCVIVDGRCMGRVVRHVEPEGGISPFQVKRRMHGLKVKELPVLDLTSPDVQKALGVSEKALTGNTLATCRRIADLARRRPDRIGGILAPSAAGPYQTLVVFRERIEAHVTVERSRLGPPPLRLIAVFRQVARTLPRRLRKPTENLLNEIETGIG